jgi:hypothetical protein
VPTGIVGQPFHFQETNLIKAAGENVDNVAIVGRPLSQSFVELESLLVVLDIIPVDVMMRADWLSQLGSNNHSRPFSCRSTCEEHDTPTSILEGALE